MLAPAARASAAGANPTDNPGLPQRLGTQVDQARIETGSAEGRTRDAVARLVH
ncbi:MAG: hypothetical protein QOE23_1108, partial [Pseudonocardiales bacterium]|nr:hypothetical protein [Pseudonocardiales bacterium]